MITRLLQLVFNPEMYPNFYRFLGLQNLTGHLISNTTTFSASTDGGASDWAGKGVLNLLFDLSSLASLGMWRMVFDIARFKACAVRVLSEDGELSIEAYLRREGYSTQFKDMFLIVRNRARLCLCGRFGSDLNCYSPSRQRSGVPHQMLPQPSSQLRP